MTTQNTIKASYYRNESNPVLNHIIRDPENFGYTIISSAYYLLDTEYDINCVEILVKPIPNDVGKIVTIEATKAQWDAIKNRCDEMLKMLTGN